MRGLCLVSRRAAAAGSGSAAAFLGEAAGDFAAAFFNSLPTFLTFSFFASLGADFETFFSGLAYFSGEEAFTLSGERAALTGEALTGDSSPLDGVLPRVCLVPTKA